MIRNKRNVETSDHDKKRDVTEKPNEYNHKKKNYEQQSSAF